MPVDSRSKTANVEVDKAAMVMGHKGTKICPNYTLPSRSLHPVKILQYATKKMGICDGICNGHDIHRNGNELAMELEMDQEQISFEEISNGVMMD